MGSHRRALALMAFAQFAACAQAGALPDDLGERLDARAASPIDARIINSPSDAAIDAHVPIEVDAAPTSTSHALVDDTAADFQSGAASLAEATVESWGAIAPVAYYTGGLLHRGSDTGVLSSSGASWGDLAAMPPTAKTAIAWTIGANWGAGTPSSVGLSHGDDWSQWWEGEVLLDAGTWTFTLLVDQHGFVELAPSGSSAYSRVVAADWPNQTTASFEAAASGWHPIRIAMSEGQGNAQIDLRLAGPGVASQPIPRHRLRARVDHVAGMAMAAFDDSRGVGSVATTIDATGPANVSWGSGSPADVGLSSPELFSVRWTGQLRIDVAGDYVFRYATDDGQRLWVNGTRVLNSWHDTVANSVTSPIALTPGWHDLVIDVSEHVGAAAANLRVESGPELAGSALPVARLRPVEARSQRIATAVNRTDLAIPDNGSVTSTMVVAAPAEARVSAVDVNFLATHSYHGDLQFRLIAPNGAEVILRQNEGDSRSGALEGRYTTAALAGAPVAGTWMLRVSDTTGRDTGSLLDVAVTPQFAGGEAPIPALAVYESTVRELAGPVQAIDTVSWTARLPAGSAVALRLRTCPTPEECASATWSDPVTTSGQAPSIQLHRYLQYRVEMTSNGDRPPAVDSVRIDYRAAS